TPTISASRPNDTQAVRSGRACRYSASQTSASDWGRARAVRSQNTFSNSNRRADPLRRWGAVPGRSFELGWAAIPSELLIPAVPAQLVVQRNCVFGGDLLERLDRPAERQRLVPGRPVAALLVLERQSPGVLLPILVAGPDQDRHVVRRELQFARAAQVGIAQVA